MSPDERRQWHQAQLTALAGRLEAIRAGLKLQAIAQGRCSTATVHGALKGHNLKLTTLLDVADGLECDVEIVLKPRRSVSRTSSAIQRIVPAPQ